MSQHIKSLLHQLQPFFLSAANSSPSTSTSNATPASNVTPTRHVVNKSSNKTSTLPRIGRSVATAESSHISSKHQLISNKHPILSVTATATRRRTASHCKQCSLNVLHQRNHHHHKHYDLGSASDESCSVSSSSSSSSASLSQASTNIYMFDQPADQEVKKKRATKRRLADASPKTLLADSGLESSSLFSSATRPFGTTTTSYYQLDTFSATRNSSRSQRVNKQHQHQSHQCNECAKRSTRATQLLKRLRKAYTSYIDSNLDATKFANIPLLVVKSFNASATAVNVSPSSPVQSSVASSVSGMISCKRGQAVNALFLSENRQWLFVKTSSDALGYIPRKCCEPFAITAAATKFCSCPLSTQQSNTLRVPKVHPKSKKSINFGKPTLPASNPPSKQALRQPEHTSTSCHDHTYMTIFDYTSEQPHQQQQQQQQQLPKLDDDESKIYELFDESNNATDLSLFSISNSQSHHNSKQQAETNYINLFDDEIIATPRRSATTTTATSEEHYEKLANCASSSLPPRSHQQVDSYLLMSEASAASVSTNQYDVLMSCKSAKKTTPPSTKSAQADRSARQEMLNANTGAYYNCSQPQQQQQHFFPTLFKVIGDYQADFKDDLSVQRGDIVYLVDQQQQQQQQQFNCAGGDWLFVRLYKRKSATQRAILDQVVASDASNVSTQLTYENLAGSSINSNTVTPVTHQKCKASKLQGFVPRHCVVKM